MRRKSIAPGTRLVFPITEAELDLLLSRPFLDPATEAILEMAVPAGSGLAVWLTLDDVDELLGCVAAEANHCLDARLKKKYTALFQRLEKLLYTHTDEEPARHALVRPMRPARPAYTPKQGQYLAYIYYYTKIHRRPPAEADLQEYFRVTPPSVHQMIVALLARGLITKVAGKPRSIELKITRADLPDLD